MVNMFIYLQFTRCPPVWQHYVRSQNRQGKYICSTHTASSKFIPSFHTFCQVYLSACAIQTIFLQKETAIYQGCGNSRICYLSRYKLMAIMYLSIENFTCPKEEISLYLSCFFENSMKKSDINSSKQYGS